MAAGRPRVSAGRGVAAAALAALAAACTHAVTVAPLAAVQAAGTATPTVTPTSVPALGPMSYGAFPATSDGESALALCEQWAGLRGQYVPRVQARHTAFQLEQWFSSAVWARAFAASNPLRVDPAYTNLSIAFVLATSGDIAGIRYARMLDRACAAAD